jgi:hypothetical protein
MSRLLTRLALCSLLWLPLAAAGEALGSVPDWDVIAEVDVVRVVTQDEDGELRDKKAWFVVLDGQGYIRTGGSRWGENLARDPKLVLRIDEIEYPLRVEFVEDDALRERIVATFREKYGFFDALMKPLRGSHPKIMRVVPR